MTEDARRYAPAVARNREPILEVLQRYLPLRGLVLEVASGSGEHVTHFAKTSAPDLIFQPSDPDSGARASIDAWTAALGLRSAISGGQSGSTPRQRFGPSHAQTASFAST
jgi:hypothetical protein